MINHNKVHMPHTLIHHFDIYNNASSNKESIDGLNIYSHQHNFHSCKNPDYKMHILYVSIQYSFLQTVDNRLQLQNSKINIFLFYHSFSYSYWNLPHIHFQFYNIEKIVLKQNHLDIE